MTKQKLKTIIGSRGFGIVWCSTFLLFAVTMGILNSLHGQSISAAFCWALVGFMVAMLLQYVFSFYWVRHDIREIRAQKQAAQESIEAAGEALKADLRRFAREHGWDMEIHDGPPLRRH